MRCGRNLSLGKDAPCTRPIERFGDIIAQPTWWATPSIRTNLRFSEATGIVFFSHQFGSFLGGWGAGRLYDIQGNYDLMWWICVGLGVFAALIHWFIREQPVERLTLVAVRS
jgi:uncharacterized membrane protein